jgi:hypothetical protein
MRPTRTETVRMGADEQRAVLIGTQARLSVVSGDSESSGISSFRYPRGVSHGGDMATSVMVARVHVYTRVTCSTAYSA